MIEFSIIRGIVEDLKIAEEHEDLIFNNVDKDRMGIASVGAGLLGQSFNSIELAKASLGADIDMEFFTCMVSGNLLSGRFHKVEFKENEVIDFVVENNSKEFLVHAARSESQRMLWMPPYQCRGFSAQKRSDLKWTLILSIFATIAVEFSEIFIFKNHLDTPFFYQILLLVEIFITVLAINIFVRRRFIKFSKNATNVFYALGYENPQEVDLYRIHKKAQNKIKFETRILPPLVEPWSFRF